ncbi:hypothetical protein ABZP36_011816 [Zizania latifolia]
MLEKTVTKEPGQSWIILDKVLHTFHSSERFHPSKKDIDAKIKEICANIKAAGFVPDLSCVLHDVDDEQKERMLLGHREKLALTFGLMNTPPGLTIQVITQEVSKDFPEGMAIAYSYKLMLHTFNLVGAKVFTLQSTTPIVQSERLLRKDELLLADNTHKCGISHVHA